MHGEGLQGGDPSAADPPNIFTGAPEGVGSGGDPAEANVSALVLDCVLHC